MFQKRAGAMQGACFILMLDVRQTSKLRRKMLRLTPIVRINPAFQTLMTSFTIE